MKKTRKSSKLISFIMAFLILIVSLPTYTFASLVETEADTIETEDLQDVAVSCEDGVYVLEEDISLREENVKHFKLSNGTVKAVSYANAVHYKDADGNWIDIDNSLTLNGSEYTANNKSEIKFANKSDSNGLLSIKDGEYKIDFTPLNTNKVSVEIENPEGNNSRKFDDVKKLNNIVSKATYKGIYDGIDLEYILVGNNIKENIIVNEKQEGYTYSFEIKLNKLNATLENNVVILTDSDTGEKVYEIPAPYMLDANGEYSDMVEYTLTKDSKWKYTFTVTADPSWINDDERQFPVKIDPSVIVDSSNIFDINVVHDPIIVNGTKTGIRVDKEDNGALIVGNFVNYLYDSVSFMKIQSLPQIPAATELTSASLSFEVYGFFNDTNLSKLVLGIYPAIADWTGLDDEDRPSGYSVFEAYCGENASPTSTKDISSKIIYNCDITKLYNSWMIGAPNYGFCLRGMNLPEDDGKSATDEDIAAYIVASNGLTEDHTTPQFELTYTYKAGVEDYYAYAENTLGDVGKSYVNLYNGSLTYINHLTSIEVGPNLTYDIDMVYNSIEKTWRPSFAECITPYNNYEDEVYDQINGIEIYIWRDPDGTNHVFSPYMEKNSSGNYIQYEYLANGNKKVVTDPTVFYPEDDIDYVLIQTENNEFILRDYDGNQKMFDSQGRLSKICDAQGNVLYFEYWDDGNLASLFCKNQNNEIVELINLKYGDANRLAMIHDYQNHLDISLGWKDMRITSISYKDDNQIVYNTIKFYYFENSELLKSIINNLAQKTLIYGKYNDEQYSKIEESLNNNDATQYLLEYNWGDNENQTLVTNGGTDFDSDADNFAIATYTFDFKGREVVTSQTYDDSLMPDNSYYYISYNQSIYDELMFNLVKYNIETGQKEFINFVSQNTTVPTVQMQTAGTTHTYDNVDDNEVENNPYKMVCQIISSYEGTTQGTISTGFLCGANTIIMSAHGIFEDITNDGIYNPKLPSQMIVSPGVYYNESSGSMAPSNLEFNVKTIYVPKEYYFSTKQGDTESDDVDWGVCVLEEEAGSQFGYFNLTVPSDDFINKKTLALGYPGRNQDMIYANGKILENNEEKILLISYGNSGMSGGPVIINIETNTVCGIIVSGTTSRVTAKSINLFIYNLVNDLNLIE